MITLLRRIRRSLIESGSARKYLVYAIGEIALVVFGILIALQINNWNEGRKKRQVEIETLLELKEGMRTNQELLSKENQAFQNDIKEIRSLLVHLRERRPYHDSLEALFYYPYRGNAPFVGLSGMKLLESRGVDIISNPDLRRKIVYYFEYNHAIIQRMIGSEEARLENFRMDFQKKFGQRIDEEFTGHTGRAYFKTYTNDYMNLLDDIEFQQELEWKITRRLMIINRVRTHLIDPSEALIHEIDEEVGVLRRL